MKILLKILGYIWTIAFLIFAALMLYSFSGHELPQNVLVYISKFENFLDTFLSSSWFFVVFVCGWFGVSFMLARDSGWQNLASKYATKISVNTFKKLYVGNGYIGKTRHNGILKVSANKSGIFLSVLLPFKFGHKNLFFPWSDISAVKSEKGLYSGKTPNIIKSLNEIFRKNGYLNIKLKYYPKQRLIVHYPAELLELIPSDLITKMEL